ncbi:30S ribosomal protein S17 [Geodia barretti]|uniref:Small ribosomal subunit protein uS17 n=1 Tax=Geodia barretti TaxID=519541 RepID=A0AA35SLW8_GEOBA|nr:30S ribosomal protein S17 [Geodia barretti]
MYEIRALSDDQIREELEKSYKELMNLRFRDATNQCARVTRFYVHDPDNQCRIGDTVRIQETRPISRTKHWRLLDIMARREVADVRPIDLEDSSLLRTAAAESDEEPNDAEDAAMEDADDEEA